MKPIYSLLMMLICNVLIAQNPDVVIDASKAIQINQDESIVGKRIPLQDEVSKSNTLSKLENQEGNLVWTYHIKAENAKGLVAYFDVLTLGNNTQIRAYSPLNGTTTKPFFSNGNMRSNSFALPLIEGDEMIIEIICKSSDAWDQLDFAISDVGVLNSLSGFGDAPACFVNVNCSEGDPWQNQKRSVARYMTTIGGEIGFCTGVLVNNTSGDCKNYFLSAQHCSLGATDTELGQYVFYFNYEAPDCASPASDMGLDQQTVVGCQMIAQSGDGSLGGGFPDRSDFSLLEINDIPVEYNVYYSGWNRSPLNGLQGNGAIIQHPLADLKKISFWDNVTASATSADHLYTEMIASTNGDGIVEPMSSGSPIFDVNKQVIGNVTSGDSGCISDVMTGTPIAQAGRFEIHWDQCGTTDNRQLKPWLDPANTGTMTLDGKNQCDEVSTINVDGSYFEVNILPNPVKDNIYIQTNLNEMHASIFSVNGVLLMSKENPTFFDVSTLPGGLYFVVIYADGAVLSERFIKK